jgi:hypothetical protein
MVGTPATIGEEMEEWLKLGLISGSFDYIPHSLFREKNSLIRIWKFPVPLLREFGCKLLDLRVDQTRKSRGWMSAFCEFPVIFPVSREFAAETGSQLTASSTGQYVSNAYGIGSRDVS